MKNIKEKYTIQITDVGVEILATNSKEIHLTAVEALMLLDILKNEEKTLIKMAEAVSPIPTKVCP